MSTLLIRCILPLLCVGPSGTSFQNASFLGYTSSIATIRCSFFNYTPFYCLLCCSTDPSIPPASSVYNISTTSGTDVTVSLGGLTSGQMYYCKAAATNITSAAQCGGSLLDGEKLFFSFKTPDIPKLPTGNRKVHAIINIQDIIVGHMGAWTCKFVH